MCWSKAKDQTTLPPVTVSLTYRHMCGHLWVAIYNVTTNYPSNNERNVPTWFKLRKHPHIHSHVHLFPKLLHLLIWPCCNYICSNPLSSFAIIYCAPCYYLFSSTRCCYRSLVEVFFICNNCIPLELCTQHLCSTRHLEG